MQRSPGTESSTLAGLAAAGAQASAGDTRGGDAARIARLFEMTSDLLAAISLDGRFTLLDRASHRCRSGAGGSNNRLCFYP